MGFKAHLKTTWDGIDPNISTIHKTFKTLFNSMLSILINII